MNNVYELKIERLNDLSNVTSFNDSEWNEIQLLSVDTDNEIRKQTAELLGFHHCKKSEDILVSMLNDVDFLVRTEACDSLYFSINEQIPKILLELYVNESYDLVKGYALLTSGDILANIGKKFDNNSLRTILLSLENVNDWVKIAIYRTLIKTGYKKYQKELIDKIESPDYRNKIFAISMIYDIIFDMDKNNIQILYEKLKTLKDKESVESVLASVQNLIDMIENNQLVNTEDGTMC